MKKTILTMLSLISLSEIAHAALPPTAESMRRIKAILESKAVYATLGSANWIQSITQENDTENYIIQTDKCSLKVTLESVLLSEKKPGMVGPAQLNVKVGKLECKNND